MTHPRLPVDWIRGCCHLGEDVDNDDMASMEGYQIVWARREGNRWHVVGDDNTMTGRSPYWQSWIPAAHIIISRREGKLWVWIPDGVQPKLYCAGAPSGVSEL